MLPVSKSKRGGGTNNQQRGRISRTKMKEELYWQSLQKKQSKGFPLIINPMCGSACPLEKNIENVVIQVQKSILLGQAIALLALECACFQYMFRKVCICLYPYVDIDKNVKELKFRTNSKYYWLVWLQKVYFVFNSQVGMAHFVIFFPSCEESNKALESHGSIIPSTHRYYVSKLILEKDYQGGI